MKMMPVFRVALGLTILAAVAASDARAQDGGAGAPGIASFQPVASPSSVPFVAVFSFASLVLGLAVMFTRRPATALAAQLTRPYRDSGLRRAQRAVAVAFVAPAEPAARSALEPRQRPT